MQFSQNGTSVFNTGARCDLTEWACSPKECSLENHCLKLDALTLTSREQSPKSDEVGRFETDANGTQPYDKCGLGCPRGIMAGAVLQAIVIAGGAMCWGLYSLLR